MGFYYRTWTCILRYLAVFCFGSFNEGTDSLSRSVVVVTWFEGHCMALREGENMTPHCRIVQYRRLQLHYIAWFWSIWTITVNLALSLVYNYTFKLYCTILVDTADGSWWILSEQHISPRSYVITNLLSRLTFRENTYRWRFRANQTVEPPPKPTFTTTSYLSWKISPSFTG